ncbi:MAG: hypothetical protein R2824_31965 [Saprospiraceae bacterium]|nr:hypothetical protein [Lewinella sp.]
MEKEQIYQTIEAYLDGELGPEDMAAFEQELATDTDLAKEVQLHRRLQQEIGDAGKINLRLSLDAIAGEFPEPPDTDSIPQTDPGTPNPGSGGSPGSIPFWVWGLGFFLIVGGGVWYYLSDLKDDPQPQISQIEEPEETPASDETTTTLSETTDTEAPAPTEPDRTVTDTPVPNAAPAVNPEVYHTNKDLELQLGDGTSKRYIFTEGDLGYIAQDEQGYLNFSAKLETSRSVDEGFFLTLYNNQYPEGQVMRGELKFDEISGERKIAFGAEVKKYLAAYTGETNLKPALYYGVVTVGTSEIPLWVGKVKVE